MQLTLNKILINNFRSIRELELPAGRLCTILVGINESGKTNILDAVSLLEGSSPIMPRDVREPHPDESPSKCSVQFFLELDAHAISTLMGRTSSRVFIDRSALIAQVSGKDLKLRDLLEHHFATATYDVDPKEGSGILFKELTGSLLCPLFKITEKPTTALSLTSGLGVSHQLKQGDLISEAYVDKVPVEIMEDATFDDLIELISDVQSAACVSKLPEVVYWRYDAKNLLPARVNLEKFTADPSSCVPLQRLFQLAGVTDISATIKAAKSGTTQAMRNLLDRVSRKATEHFRAIWKDHKSISFELFPNGEFIEPTVRDVHNNFEFSQRSDGFKRFASFLLMISTAARTSRLTNAVILIDEPEIGLHPSGARFLRDELIKTAEKNFVLYSTHSIFMIDPNTIERHLIIKKSAELTEVEQATSTAYLDEEVLHKALGCSVFDSLKERNIIFEGWRDKKLFEVAIASRLKRKYSGCAKLKSIGRCFASGVKNASAVASFVQLANRTCIVVTDGDKVARERKASHGPDESGIPWWTFKDVLPTTYATTAEDFITSSLILKAAAHVKQLRGLTAPPAFVEGRGTSETLEAWLQDNGLTGDSLRLAKDEFKKYIYAHIKATNIRAEYFDYLLSLSKRPELS